MDAVLVLKAARFEFFMRRICDVIAEFGKGCSSEACVDSIIFNFQRCCLALIDMGNRCVKMLQLSIPQSSREVFDILAKAQLIDIELCDRLKAMIGLRNIAVHDYQALNIDIVISVVENHLTDFDAFIKAIIDIKK